MTSQPGAVRPFDVTSRSVLAIAVPMTLAYLSTPLLGLVDTAVIGQLGDAALLGGIALGGVLFRYRPEGDLRTILFVCAISLGLHPAITFSLAHVFDLSGASLRSATVTAAMAPGVNAYVFANIYGRAKRVAASSVLLATGLCLVTSWLWLHALP